MCGQQKRDGVVFETLFDLLWILLLPVAAIVWIFVCCVAAWKRMFDEEGK